MNARTLVTGSSGFLGKHVVPLLRADGHEVMTPSSNSLNLLDQDAKAIASYLVVHEVSTVVHLAAICGGIGINKDNPGKFMYENLQMGLNVIEACRLANVNKLVNLSTVCSYPKNTPVPFQESDLWNGYPEETNAPYGIAKKTIVELGIAYHKQYGLNVTNLVPVNMAGEHDHFDLYSSHVVPALIRKFEEADQQREYVDIYSMYQTLPTDRALISAPSVTLWGTGSASREFLYAGDCAKAVAIAVQKNTGPDPINLGTGQEITIKQLAELVKRIGGYSANIEWDHTKPDGQPRRSLDVSRAKNVLRWEATTPIEETVRRTIEWYRQNQ